MQISAKNLADLIGGVIEGNGDVVIYKASKIEEAKAGSIAFLANLKYEPFAYTTMASALLVAKDFVAKEKIGPTLIRVDDVYNSVAFLLDKFGEERIRKGISKFTSIGKGCEIAETAFIGDFTVIGDQVTIGEGAQINTQVTIGQGAIIGKNVKIYPGVRVYKECVIGDNCILHSNCVIGSDGFGFAPNPDGTYSKVAQIGNVILEDNVEVGSNSTIDRATMGSTIIRKGTKLDNLIMVAHNVEIGENTVIAAQTGIAGSTKVGAQCSIGGQVGIVGHIKIADGSMIQAQSGINKSLKEKGGKWYGSPAVKYMDFLKSYSIFRKLPKLEERLRFLEKKES